MNVESDGKFITFRCGCGQAIKVLAERAGARGRCKSCGRKIVVPTARSESPNDVSSPLKHKVSPVHRRGFDESFSEEDLVTYPEYAPVREEEPASAEELIEDQRGLLSQLGEILEYPVSDKMATQIFLSGAILFSPLVWKTMTPFKYLGCPGLIVNVFIFFTIISIRLMYFSYLLLIIDRSAQGIRKIPELPLFQTWQDNAKDLLKVLGASAVAFSPFLAYAFATNIELLGRMLEAQSRGEVPGAQVFGGLTANLQAMFLLYATAAFYMPMTLMTLVVKRNFFKAINPVFIIRSIFRIGREYLAAMAIIFLFLRGTLTLFTIMKDVLALDWFTKLAVYIGEPILEFYVYVVTMHVIGLLYCRNWNKLQW